MANTVPDRTLLYRQELLGEGTPEVESLRSFVHRLALSHCLTPFARFEVLLEKYPLDGIVAAPIYLVQRWNLHGLGPTGAQIRTRLEMATDTRLESATLQRFASLFNDSSLIYAKGARYCPCCVKEEEGTVYGRLLWEIGCVTACPRHKVRLRSVNQCGYPATEYLPLAQRPTLPGICSHCGSIGFRCVHDEPEPASEEEICFAEMAGQLLALTVEESKTLCQESFKRGILALSKAAHQGKPFRTARAGGFEPTTVWKWLKRNQKPNLAQLLQLCLRQSIDPVSLAGGRYERQVDARPVDATYRNAQRPQNRTAPDMEEMQQQLLIAAQSIPPTPVSTLAKRLRRGASTLEKLFPAEYKELVAARQAYMTTQRALKIARESARLEIAARALEKEGRVVSKTTLRKLARIFNVTGNQDYRSTAVDIVLKRRLSEGHPNAA